jgi:hypothetical protein
VDIISMAQHARPKLMGQIEDLRAQFTAWSSLAKIKPSNPDASSVGMNRMPLQTLLCHLRIVDAIHRSTGWGKTRLACHSEEPRATRNLASA